MTNISRKKLNSDAYRVAFTELAKRLGKLKADAAEDFMHGLLTESERIMLTKRFAAILMFRQLHSPYRVSKTLAISVSTAQRLYHHYCNGRYNMLFEQVSTHEHNRFLSLIEDLIAAQASPRARARLMRGLR